ncbi:MAG: DUF4231 domain-containing protein [Oculatellaceae cyanobacterium bins.114]|nr:DUF4231 domain-containing protein [Oculatellaceae cyanobacterium bins.114]
MSDGDRTENPISTSIGSAPLDSASLSSGASSPASGNSSSSTPFNPIKTNKPKNYTDQLKDDFNAIFESLKLLSPVNAAFLRSRWLDQILWMEAKSSQCRDRHFRLRLATIIGGVIVPILVTLNVGNDRIQGYIKNGTILLSGGVAVTAAIEEFFQYGKRWYNYRRSAESLKAQGWHFFQLSGPYRTFTDHNEAFRTFAENIEEIIQHDVETYVTQNQQEKQGQGQQSVQDSNNGNQDSI